MAATGVIADFELPAGLEAAEPPEARGLRRDEVRLLVSDVENDSIEHARFSDLPRWLSPGDLLVVNASGTLNAAVAATSEDGEPFEIHLSTRLPGGLWSVEVRQPGALASLPYTDARVGTAFRLPPLAAACAVWASWSPITTSAPASANPRASAAPSPRPPPVTTTTRPVMSNS